MDLLRRRAEQGGERVVYRFLPGDNKPEQRITYKELDRRATALASAIRQHAKPGERALILVPSGLDYIATYFACLYAGVVAVPAYPPNPRRPDPRIPGIVADCEPVVALTTAALLDRLEHWRGGDERLGALRWLAADAPVDPSIAPVEHQAGAHDVAMLQYTSGSTAAPKGVVLTHANLLHNLSLIRAAFNVRHGSDDVGVFWLPPYHDMGLIGGILQPCYVGRGAVLMASATFLQRPLSWLEAMSKYRATTSAAPNFAFDMCVERIKPEDMRGLDLSAWHTVFDGAEPIRADTIERFSKAFADVGFRSEAFFPCYGLAEATLFVSGGPWGHGPYTLDVSRSELEHTRARPAMAGDRLRLVSSGAAATGQMVRIVNPDTLEPLDDRRVGEIWCSGRSVAGGYWRNPAESTRTFGATLPGDGGRYLRTGDLGFLDDGQLFVTGRLKDLIVLAGRNYYPQDIELAAERSHPSLRPGHAAAFPLDGPTRELLAVALEVTRHHRESDNEAVFAAVRRALAGRAGILPDVILLIRQNGIPRTSSGKVQRRAARAMQIENTLDVLARSDETLDDIAFAVSDGGDVSAAPLEAWLRRWVADELQIDVRSVDPTASVRDYGLDSVAAVRLVTELEQVLGHRVDVALLWREPSIRSLSKALESRGAVLSASEEDERAARRSDERLVSPLAASEFPEYRLLQARFEELDRHGLENPYFRVHDGVTGSAARIGGRDVVNFANYNYLGLSGDERVNVAAVEAIRRYGTSVSASRVVSGERSVHQELEQELAGFIGVEDCVLFIGGVTANVSTIAHLVGAGDVVLCDELLHNSAMQGALFSGAHRLAFPHNDAAAADRLLGEVRAKYRRALIVIEGVYSADGDIPDLASFVALKRRHEAWLMVDEAHSIGVLGATGRGLAEHAGVSTRSVDLWMGTLSKSLASVGGYIGARREIIQYLKYTAPGFVFSVGMAPASAAAALEALRILRREPQRVQALQANAALFLELAKGHGLNTGSSANTPIIPVITGDSLQAVRLSQQLLEHGINVQPMVAPSVSESGARLRFFVASTHSPDDIQRTVELTASLVRRS
ncbi:MAG: aminotransferase class I/II-fold pyridoxal phosphate-dependent enzyme [Gemmatimonadaceae bacterium]